MVLGQWREQEHCDHREAIVLKACPYFRNRSAPHFWILERSVRLVEARPRAASRRGVRHSNLVGFSLCTGAPRPIRTWAGVARGRRTDFYRPRSHDPAARRKTTGAFPPWDKSCATTRAFIRLREWLPASGGFKSFNRPVLTQPDCRIIHPV